MSTQCKSAVAPHTKWSTRFCSQAVSSGKDKPLTPGRALAPQGSIRQSNTLSPSPPLTHRWQFSSDGSDIGFGVFLKTKMGERQRAGDMTEVLPTQRYNAHMVPEDGSLTCAEAGVCKSVPAGPQLHRTKSFVPWFRGGNRREVTPPGTHNLG